MLDIRVAQLQSRRKNLLVPALYGPRGTGKTALLRRLKAQCEAAGFDAINMELPKLLASEESMANCLFPPSILDKVQGAALYLGTFGIQASLRKGMVGDLTSLLISRCRARPLALLLDEAHLVASEPDPLPFSFLSICRYVLADAPFLLALAGMPGLRFVLKRTSTGFMERADYHEIGLLEQAGAEEAIRVPLEEDGIAIADNALRAAAKDSQGYPYFLQSWGAALWARAMEQGNPALTKRDVQAVAAAVQEERQAVYHDRYWEIGENLDVRVVAQAAASAFAEREAIHFHAMQAIADEALLALAPDAKERADRSQAARRELELLGFMWMPDAKLEYRAGIPSLMDYTREQAANLPPG